MTDNEIKESERFNPMANAPSAATGPHAPRTAASILKIAGEEDVSKWEERNALSPSPELEEVKIEVDPAEELQSGAASAAQHDRIAVADVELRSRKSSTEEPQPTLRTRTPVRAPTSGASTPRITLRFSSPAVKAQPKTRSRTASNGRRKRKLTESEESAEESEEARPAPKRRGRGAPPPPAEGVRRSLRSRDPKNEEQKRLEEEKRARLREALASDDEEFE